MIGGSNGAYIGLLSLLSFGLSVIAAVLAIDMYRLLRTGEFGKSWRILIIAGVMFALMQALRMAEFLDWKMFQVYGLSQIVELMFVLSLAYAFYLQRQAFNHAAELREVRHARDHAATETSETANNTIRATDATTPRNDEWARLNGYDAGEDEATLSPLEDDVEWSRPAPRREPQPASSPPQP